MFERKHPEDYGQKAPTEDGGGVDRELFLVIAWRMHARARCALCRLLSTVHRYLAALISLLRFRRFSIISFPFVASLLVSTRPSFLPPRASHAGTQRARSTTHPLLQHKLVTFAGNKQDVHLYMKTTGAP